MQTIIGSAPNGVYHEVRPNQPPQAYDGLWAAQARDRLQHELAGTGLVAGVNLDEKHFVHLDLKPCTPEQRTAVFDTLLETLAKLGLHNPDQGVEYCALSSSNKR